MSYTFDFLSADVPLTKTFEQIDGGYQVTPYPFVKEVTSHREVVEDLDGLLDALHRHAELGHCLLKGALRMQISGQSRAGMTIPDQPTNWMLIDADFEDGYDSIEEFLDSLGLGDVSFIQQHSASSGITSTHGLRSHSIVLLSEPVSPGILKAWLKARNFTVEQLNERIELSANAMTLKFPLDISTCQNDKLIYIAPPTCIGFDDPIKERITLVRRTKEQAKPPKASAPEITQLSEWQDKRVNELRAANGLPKRTPRYKTRNDMEILVNPGSAVVTDVRLARGFTYINLNGGDSWAYYFPSDNPDLVFNFKGEPIVELRSIAPDFYQTYREQLRQSNREDRELQHGTSNFTPFVFRDFRKDAYFNALYFPDEQRVEYAPTASLQRLQHFMQQYGEMAPDVIEDWTVEFKPTTMQLVDFDKKWLNTFQPTAYMLEPEHPEVQRVPPLIARTIDSICGNDNEVVEHFLNWLAVIFQTRKKAGTAWIFHGVEGTGKGLLTSKVLKPLLGGEHVVEYTTKRLEDQFNAPLERALLLWIDEMEVESSSQASAIMSMLKNLITEDRIVIRGMRRDPYQVESYANVIMATNRPDPVRLSSTDRRFNVAPAQETKLIMTQEEVDSIGDEVPAFAAFLANYKADAQKARTVLENQARKQMMEASQTTIEQLFSALRGGQLDLFVNYLGQGTNLAETVQYADFELTVLGWCRDFLFNKPTVITRDEMRKAYAYIIGSTISPAKFSRLAAIHRLHLSPQRDKENKVVRGHKVQWSGDRDTIQASHDSYMQKTDGTVVSIKGAQQ